MNLLYGKSILARQRGSLWNYFLHCLYLIVYLDSIWENSWWSSEIDQTPFTMRTCLEDCLSPTLQGIPRSLSHLPVHKATVCSTSNFMSLSTTLMEDQMILLTGRKLFFLSSYKIIAVLYFLGGMYNNKEILSERNLFCFSQNKALNSVLCILIL